MKSNYFRENCFPESSIIRLNRYPPCPIPSKVYGLLPHSDTSFLSIVYQDQVGGLQLMKDGKWFGVKPNPGALVVNIGDLFQVIYLFIWSHSIPYEFVNGYFIMQLINIYVTLIMTRIRDTTRHGNMTRHDIDIDDTPNFKNYIYKVISYLIFFVQCKNLFKNLK